LSSILWHDYETFGSDPRRDRPCQFAALRTDHDLNVIDDPVEYFCKPAPDFLPHPAAVAITGISPQQALAQGLPEAEFCARIAREFMEPGTCGAGYNSLRFDDELTRTLFYRCFFDPYEREWKNGNSRWDLIDLLRMTQALRPEGINWPLREDGSPGFRLEELTKANGIEHGAAHDALADVRATIAMAKLVKTKQPKLYEFLFNLRSKHKVLPLLDLAKQEPVLHVSRMFPASRGCLAIVLPLCKHPQNPNGIIVVDLLSDPRPWLGLDAAELRHRLFTPREELADGEERIPLKTVHINRCPALAPLGVLTDEVKARYRLDMEAVYRHRQALLAASGLARKLQEVFAESGLAAQTDPDLMLYSGGFFDDHDRKLMESVRKMRPVQLVASALKFHDARLPELLFRYRARNFPETLDTDEQQRWRDYCRRRLEGELPGAGLSFAGFEEALQEAQARMPERLVADLRAYADSVRRQCQPGTA
jgi:exodeoxyribonuclease-1